MPAPRFTPRPRNDRDPSALEERWPSLQASFLDLLAECAMIVEHGRNEFDAARSLTYRAAEAEALWQDITRNRPDGQSVNALLLQHPEL